MTPLRPVRSAIKLAILIAVLCMVYRGGVELGKRRAHKKVTDPIMRLFSTKESPEPVSETWDEASSAEPGADPFALDGEDDWSSIDPFSDPAVSID